MSDPMNRPNPDPTRGNVPPPVDPPPGEPRKGNPLLWILVLIALLALAWYFLSQRDGVPVPPPEPTAPIGQTDTETPDGDTASRTDRPARKPAASTRQSAATADREATVSSQVAPDYPVAAARNREEGTVLVRAEVDAAGKPTNVEGVRRSGSRDLDRAAVAAVKRWSFQPAIRDGKAVASTVQVPVEFTLDRM